VKNEINTFENITKEMPILLEKLNNNPMVNKDEIRMGQVSIPQKGIYILFENDKPIYVGRSNNIKQRLNGHCNQWSDRFSATFAFRLAIKEYESKYQKRVKGIRREDLESDSDFSILFQKAKARVAAMGIKVVEIEDPITQTIFEVYAAMKLDTLEFNSFDNH
jgi:predicted GIY-YIG superfamily endonuclease